MKSHEAIRRMVGGYHEEIAKAIHRSANLVYRWTLPALDYTDSGAFNDLDRVENGMRRALELGVPQVDALAPVHYLANRFDGYFLPPVPHTCRTKDVAKQLTRTMKEASEAFAEAARALDDDDLSKAERKRILKEAYEAMHELAAFARMIEDLDGAEG